MKGYNVVIITISDTRILLFSVPFILSQSPHERQHGQTSHSWHFLFLFCLLSPCVSESSNCSCFLFLKSLAPASPNVPCSCMMLMENRSVCGTDGLSFPAMFSVVCVHTSSFLSFHLTACLAEPHRQPNRLPLQPALFLLPQWLKCLHPSIYPSLVIKSVRPFK